MQYPHSKEKELNMELFKNPPSEYRSEPFWALNNRFEKPEFAKQIKGFKDMGFGGFFMHPRPGNQLEYMSEEFLDAIRFSIDEAKKNGLLSGLYDDDRWPSGYAGGNVARTHPEFRQKFIRFSEEKNENDIPLAEYSVVLDKDGYLVSYSKGGCGEGRKYYAGISTFQPTSWYGNSWYSDTLNKDALDLFIELTHKKYREVFGDEFGKTIPSIFSDEAQFEKADKPFTGTNSEALNPWTDGMEEIFVKEYGYSLIDRIPELVFTKREYVKVQYDYYRLLLKLFSAAYSDNVGKWCTENGLPFTGHYMCEYPIENQVRANAEAMRCYKGMSIPGVDMLIDLHEYITVKQAASVAHQHSKEGVMSEEYGVTGWQFDFAGYLHQGDWQAALGVTLRVPHLSWMSMESEAKRDFPPSINYQAPWHTRFSLLEDHFARVNTVMTRGKPVVRIGIIHPVESYWLLTGDKPHNAEKINKLNRSIEQLTENLLDLNLDFDFISESLLQEQYKGCENGFGVGDMVYDAVIIPEMITIRSETLERLKEFMLAGGKVFAKAYPELVDCKAEFSGDDGKGIKLLSENICEDLGYLGIVDVTENGVHAGGYIYNLRNDGGELRMFMCPRSKPERKEKYSPRRLTVSVDGTYYPEYMDTFSGDVYPYPFEHKNGRTYMEFTVYPLDSLCLALHGKPCGSPVKAQEEKTVTESVVLGGLYGYTLEEPNVYFLDYCSVSLDGTFKTSDELFRCQTALKEYESANGKGRTLRVTFNVESSTDCDTELALENAENASVMLNGTKAEGKITGYYIDRSIKTVHLGGIRKGVNVIEVEYDNSTLRTLEPMYLLGDFGLIKNDRKFVICKKPDTLPFGDISENGLLFYGANMTYHVDTPECSEYTVSFPSIEGALAEVYEDGKLVGSAFAPPYSVSYKGEKRIHRIDIVYYGNRYNTLMPVHNADMVTRWYGGHLWFQKGEKFTYDYLLRPAGFAKPPVIEYR